MSLHVGLQHESGNDIPEDYTSLCTPYKNIILLGKYTMYHEHSDVLEMAFALLTYLGHCKIIVKSIDVHWIATINTSN